MTLSEVVIAIGLGFILLLAYRADNRPRRGRGRNRTLLHTATYIPLHEHRRRKTVISYVRSMRHTPEFWVKIVSVLTSLLAVSAESGFRYAMQMMAAVVVFAMTIGYTLWRRQTPRRSMLRTRRTPWG